MFPLPLSALLLLPILLPELLVNAHVGTNYKYHLTGGLYCYDLVNKLQEPMNNVKVALWEKDYWDEPGKAPDDHMGDAIVKDAKFELWGSEDEGKEPEPYIYILHNCNDPARNYPSYVTRVWLKPEPEDQDVYIFLGQGEHAEMRETGKDAVPLKMDTVSG